MTKKRIGYCLL